MTGCNRKDDLLSVSTADSSTNPTALPALPALPVLPVAMDEDEACCGDHAPFVALMPQEADDESSEEDISYDENLRFVEEALQEVDLLAGGAFLQDGDLVLAGNLLHLDFDDDEAMAEGAGVPEVYIAVPVQGEQGPEEDLEGAGAGPLPENNSQSEGRSGVEGGEGGSEEGDEGLLGVADSEDESLYVVEGMEACSSEGSTLDDSFADDIGPFDLQPETLESYS
jgi:hypothetical protein